MITNAPTKQMKILEPSATPSHRMAMGIQAMGGMGLSTSKMGETIFSHTRFQPMYSPSGRPSRMARKKAMSTRRRLQPICPHRLVPPMLAWSSRRASFTTARGEGRNSALTLREMMPHKRMNTPMDAAGAMRLAPRLERIM